MVEVVPHNGKETTVQAFVALQHVEDAGYRHVPTLLQTPDGRQSLLDEALWELEIFRQKYKEIKELVEVFEAIEKVNHRRK